MPETTGNEDGWVVARISALERANRRLWASLAALGMTLVSVCIAALFFAASVGLPGQAGFRSGGQGARRVVADDITVSGALRVVDEAGRNLVFIGRERPAAGAGSGAGQAVIGLFASPGDAAPQQTIRLATSALGSALSLSTPDGSSTSSIFAGASGSLLELRRGETSQVLSEDATDLAPGGRAVTSRESRRTEAPAVPGANSDGRERGAVVDLNDPALQPLGNGFYVGRLSISDQSGVLRVSGRLVNATSVDQMRAEFRLTVAGRELPFSVGQIEAGGSTAFAVELPSVSAAALRSARFRWVRSTLSYLSD